MARKLLSISILLLMFLSGCDLFASTAHIKVSIQDFNTQNQVEVQPGTTVHQALEKAGVSLEPLDRVDPSLTTQLTQDSTIRIIRIKEEFETQQSIIPFEQQTVKNESLPQNQSVLIQSGSNGLKQDTYRILSENGVKTTRTFISSEILQPAIPEIVMVGVQSPFTPQSFSGIIAYISSSSAWIIQGSTMNRRLVVSTGDLDGRIFTISPDRDWLLFSRSSQEQGVINSLWIVDIRSSESLPIDTGIRNVVNYADWVPGRGRTFAYSTVDPVDYAPGWDANNDLYVFRFNVDGRSSDNRLVVDKNPGGMSGWWGTSFEWSTDGSKVAYSRPDSIGLVDQTSGTFIPLVEFEGYNTGSDWAWIPSIKWSPDDSILYTVLLPASSTGILQNPELAAVIVSSGQVISMIQNCGLFCYPIPSAPSNEGRYSIAYLNAILPDQSLSSHYALKIMDRDGSNQRKLFPGEGIQGLKPQLLHWSPESGMDHLLAAVAQDNLILVNTESGAIQQVTGDGSISKIDWK